MKTYQIRFPKASATAQLAMTNLGSDLYRLEETPLLLEEELYFHDIIKAKSCPLHGLEFGQLVERSGLRVVSLLMSKKIIDSEECQEILRRVEATGGTWEIVFGGCLLMYLPPDVTYNPEEAFHALDYANLNPAAVALSRQTIRGDITFDL